MNIKYHKFLIFWKFNGVKEPVYMNAEFAIDDLTYCVLEVRRKIKEIESEHPDYLGATTCGYQYEGSVELY